MNINGKGLDIIKEAEGCQLEAYICPAGVLTIGYGHTGPDVVEGMVINHQQADLMLKRDVKRFERCIQNCVIVPLNENQFSALVSFTFNVGCESFKKSTLLKKLNAGDTIGASNEFKKWVNGGGKPLRGLVARREEEAELFLEPPNVR